MRDVYLDCAAAMPPDPEVLEFYAAKLRECYANQEAIHAMAYRERRQLGEAENRLARLLTGSADNPVLWGTSATDLFRMLAAVPGFDRTAISALEHPALTANFRAKPYCAVWPAERDGRVRPVPEERAFDAVFLHQVQSELGVIQDLETLFAAAPGACRMTDAVQAAGKLPLFPGADVWVISGVKFGAPGGAAAILNARGRFADRILAHAAKFRSEAYAAGRVSVPLALALVRAAEIAESRREREFQRLTVLRRRIVARAAAWGVRPTLPETAATSPYILNLLLPHQQSAVIVRALSEAGVYAAPGSACRAESNTPSAALLAVGCSRNEAYRALRLSFGPGTTDADADFLLAELEKALKNY